MVQQFLKLGLYNRVSTSSNTTFYLWGNATFAAKELPTNECWIPLWYTSANLKVSKIWFCLFVKENYADEKYATSGKQLMQFMNIFDSSPWKVTASGLLFTGLISFSKNCKIHKICLFIGQHSAKTNKSWYYMHKRMVQICLKQWW